MDDRPLPWLRHALATARVDLDRWQRETARWFVVPMWALRPVRPPRVRRMHADYRRRQLARRRRRRSS